MADRATKVGISDPLDLVDPTPVSPHYESDADGLPVTGFFRAGLGLWNGTTYDRARGDTTSGLWVNIKNLGQQLEAASVPVVLTAAQLTTLTPYAPITNYALEAGGNLATAVSSLSVLDDWDESDRAKVNPIAGQVGVQGGAGAVTANTQRVVIATDQSLIPVVGNVAHDSADSGSPVKIGFKAEDAVATATMVADGDRVDAIADLDGVQIVKHYASNKDLKSTTQSVTATTSTAATNFGAVASTKNFITNITVFNSSATDTYLKIQDGSGGTTFWVVPCPKGGGAVVTFPTPLVQPTANTALYFAANAAVTTLFVSIAGFQSKAY